MFIRETTQEDVDYLAAHSASRGIFNKMPQRTEWSYALIDGNDTLVVGGISMINHSTAWAGFDMSEAGKKQPVAVYRAVSTFLENLAKEFKIRRIMAYVEVGFEEAERTIVHLGFHEESQMANFVDELPASLFVRFFEVK